MICYAMQCYAMLYHEIPRYRGTNYIIRIGSDMRCYAMLCYTMRYYDIP